MSALDDDDPGREAEKMAAQWAEYQRAVRTHLDNLREHMVAVAVARLMPVEDGVVVDDGPAMAALDEYFGRIDLDLRSDLLWHALWDGGRSVEREARTRLLKLRDAWTTEGIEALR